MRVAGANPWRWDLLQYPWRLLGARIKTARMLQRHELTARVHRAVRSPRTSHCSKDTGSTRPEAVIGHHWSGKRTRRAIAAFMGMDWRRTRAAPACAAPVRTDRPVR